MKPEHGKQKGSIELLLRGGLKSVPIASVVDLIVA